MSSFFKLLERNFLRQQIAYSNLYFQITIFFRNRDELADKIMVTRQAVSRWENGDTVPNTDTLKLLSKEFDVSINTLLGEPRKLICQCCGMPIDDDSILGRDKDGTLNEEYCKWCYADGTYTYNDMDELIDVMTAEWRQAGSPRT